MQNTVMANWKHYSFTDDDDPQHDLCPSGSTSWWGYQRDAAKNSKEFSLDNSLPFPVAMAIKPISEDLSKDNCSQLVCMVACRISTNHSTA